MSYIYTDENEWYKQHITDTKDDKVYIGYIDENFVNDFDGLELKINTATKDRPISRSYVSTSDSYLNTMKHICGDEEKVQEYNLVDLYLDHYSERKVIYNRNMKGSFLPNMKFTKSQFAHNMMIDSYSFNLRDNNNKIKFIEF